MNLNTILLLLLVIASYTNLFLSFQRRRKRINRRNVQLKEWEGLNPERKSFTLTDKKFKEWMKNTKNLDK
tara:strand:+ start:675 stop:884 length:210 start_codon:yes stop_codon:yes gene_type:complete